MLEVTHRFHKILLVSHILDVEMLQAWQVFDLQHLAQAQHSMPIALKQKTWEENTTQDATCGN